SFFRDCNTYGCWTAVDIVRKQYLLHHRDGRRTVSNFTVWKTCSNQRQSHAWLNSARHERGAQATKATIKRVDNVKKLAEKGEYRINDSFTDDDAELVPMLYEDYVLLQRVGFWRGIPTLLKGDKQMLCKNDELINDKKLRCIELKGEGLWQEVQ
ncbi:MAG: hypothetical protein J6K75_08255, partial [Erysipelotrichaceae bacterium]|nr:hypothetical protein [Erysipelotrichaceae bacterium]